MKKILLTLLILSTKIILCQSLNGYKYVVVSPLTYTNGGVDIYGINETVKRIIVDKGFKILNQFEALDIQAEVQNNPCLVLTCTVNHTNDVSITILYGSNNLNISLKNCMGQVVYSGNGNCGAANYRLAKELQKCARRALEPLINLNYTFDSTATPEMRLPEVEKTSETEESIKTYLLSNKLDPIEGIYKSYQNDDLSYYKFGIIKKGAVYKAIIIESNRRQWKSGEVKATFEQTSMKGFYSAKWYMGNKIAYETFGLMDNDALLFIEFKDGKTKEKRQDKFIKMYPATASNITFNKDSPKATGSGFFVSSSGIIATNAHVVKGANKIEITISNEIATFTYKANVLLVDDKNDVALIQVDDEKFSGLSSIPYNLVDKSEVGEKVFTIGYPLNDVMGNNYKVSDGIISSKTGIADDVRYFQISVPLQPGNSGGPLFNKEGNIIGIVSAKLDGKAIRTEVQNVNYAIKASYLLSLYNMSPNAVKFASKSGIETKQMQDQVKILKNYVCLIKIY